MIVKVGSQVGGVDVDDLFIDLELYPRRREPFYDIFNFVRVEQLEQIFEVLLNFHCIAVVGTLLLQFVLQVADLTSMLNPLYLKRIHLIFFFLQFFVSLSNTNVCIINHTGIIFQMLNDVNTFC